MSFILLASLTISSCTNDRQHNLDNDQQSYNLVKQQLSTLRNDITEMQGDIAKLRNSLSQLPKQQQILAPEKVKLDSTLEIGHQAAEIAIVEFMDYQCPFCVRHAKNTYPAIKKNYIDTGKVKYLTYDFPLDFHKEAKTASFATHCAKAVGRYTEMREELLNNYRKLSKQLISEIANKLQLDNEKFDTCMNNNAIASKIDANFKYGTSLGVSGTPKFFIGRVNGNVMTDVIVISGAQPYSKFEHAIEKISTRINNDKSK